MKILASNEYQAPSESTGNVLVLANDVNALEVNLDGITQVDLHFPNFTDGRAFSQAYLLRRRLKFAGDIRATGDVLIDQLVQMERTGFSSAVLREGVDAADAQRQFERFGGFYQADAVHTQPHFVEVQA
ncbi:MULTISPECIES: DUF934 domain-containing protein [Comamonas]|jgi:uncharacterized protein (DUF934 family)|uniref:Uncharacterized protein conserved in bacteria n=1 Tax=Comamonas testosteroni TaxID=285 RepID=A0A8B4S6Y4_COMTE|nr:MULTISPECIES: DUF934 domain-containing protein [Comamonas]ACY33917.1 hypothetical conserved protein [Comamonas thiooxydans]EHN63600.1 hypothetical protein CTATCC11996_21608 [Comamonas testosteroni ATCC 11996]KKI12588.1 hypothetical protein XA67_19010 [Comamonas thiooxydans]MBL5980045.1 DUF934 domain-containing protein [Comamonas sp. NyZ500]MDO1473779.1 DUF934 domain-containing protein [Comamonas thiooxydans]